MKTSLIQGTSDLPGGDARVTGGLANLAASQTAIVSFDLGTDWDHYEQVDVMINVAGPASGGNVQLFGSNTLGETTVAPTKARRLGYQYNTAPSGVQSLITSSGGAQNIFVRPWGRYLMLSITNADGANAFGAGSFAAFLAYPRTSSMQ